VREGAPVRHLHDWDTPCGFLVAILTLVKSNRIPKAVGTYGMLDFRRNPGFRHGDNWRKHVPTSIDGISDIEAVRAGESRQVSCFIRGDHEHLPSKSKQGVLVVSNGGVSWTPFWSRKRKPLAVPAVTGGIATRNQGKGDVGPLIVGRAESGFTVITCDSLAGSVELAVPMADVPLVVFSLETIRQRPTPD
jgi:hypothetical protein